MKYCSTRGARDVSFKEAALSGWCDRDGGMFLPQDIPLISTDVLEQWRELSYADLAVEVLHQFIAEEEISHANLRTIVQKAVAPFALKEVIAMHPLDQKGTLLVCDLWNGPSLAFKDLGMSILCGILDHFLEEDDSRLNILVGTSGDTGPSALVAIKDKPRLSLIVLYPLGRVSDAQELQMLHTERQSDGHLKNLRVAAVEGTSDDLDRPIEVILQNPELRTQHKLGSVNSVNIVRMLAQMIHFFFCYFRAVPAGSSEHVSFAIPTGAAGHAVSCLLAKLAGLPINKILVANNQNDVLAAILNQRVVRRLEEVHMTCAPAMDIQVPYNVERLFFLATMSDTAQVAELMEALRSGSQAAVPAPIADYFARHGFIAAATSDAAVKHTMRQTAAQGRLQDPHTSVGVHAALEAIQQDASVLPMVCMGCAHPVKFLTTVAEAIGSSGDQSPAVPAALDLGVASVLPDVDSNPHVSQLLALLREKASNEHGALGPQRVFRRGEDWVQNLLDLLKEL